MFSKYYILFDPKVCSCSVIRAAYLTFHLCDDCVDYGFTKTLQKYEIPLKLLFCFHYKYCSYTNLSEDSVDAMGAPASVKSVSRRALLMSSISISISLLNSLFSMQSTSS